MECHDSIVKAVVEKFLQRSAVGIAKYGVTLDRTDLGVLDWIQHAQEELMDGILYLEKLKQTLAIPKYQAQAGGHKKVEGTILTTFS